MYRHPKNPKILELTKTYKKRAYKLTSLIAIVKDEGHVAKHFCAWCADTALTGQQRKWCSPECSSMAWAWANPQKESGLCILLARQDFKCNLCQFDYMPYVEDTLKYLNKNHPTIDPLTIKTQIHDRMAKILKYKTPSDRLPEVDHIVPIYKGGESIGFDNHQAICYSCHKTKTKVDNSGKRKK